MPPCEDPDRRLRLEADDAAWLAYYFGPGCELPEPFTYEFTSQQQEMIRIIAQAIIHGGDQAMAASRGEGKTTFARRVTIKYTLQGLLHFAVLFGATGSAAENSLEDIKISLTDNVRLLADYPEVVVPIRALENTPNRAHYQTVTGRRHDTGEPYTAHQSKFSWCGQQISLPNVPGSPASGAIIATRGLDSAVRGLNIRGHRPQLALIDDPDTEETIRSEDQAAKLEERIEKAIGGLGGQRKPIARVMLVTIASRTSVAFRYTDPEQKPSFKGHRYRFLARPPARLDLWDEYIRLRQRSLTDYALKKGEDPHAREAHRFLMNHYADMHAGAEVTNPNRYDDRLLADGTQYEISALQRYYNEVARIGAESVATELDNDPPEDAHTDSTHLTAYHIQEHCRSGLDQHVVPHEAVAVTAGLDIKKLGFHYCVWAWHEDASGVCIDYGFHEIHGATQLEMQAVELAVLRGLHEWREMRDAEQYVDTLGVARQIDLTLIDAGWKDESWIGQPVQHFCQEAGTRYGPCKGAAPYREPPKSVLGDNWHINAAGLVNASADHWKMKVHEGFLTPPDQPGSLTLFNPTSRPPHLSFAKHLTSEIWTTRFVPGFGANKTGWYKTGSQNHWFDATYMALVARSVLGVSVLPTATERPPLQATAPPSVYQPSPSLYDSSRQRW